MKDYYQIILLKLIDASNELDEYFIKNIADVIQEMNYIDLLLAVTIAKKD